MAQNLIETTISTKELTFRPGSLPAAFEVTVINHSDRFATFILEITAAGADPENGSNWYKLSPEICTKKPPGDSTQFLVKIVDTPVPGFVGQMNLTVRVFSIELQDENRQLLRLILQEGTGSTPLKLNLPLKEFQVYPGNQFKVPVRVSNPSQQPASVALRCLGLDPEWLIEGMEQHLQLPPGGQTETAFLCQVPGVAQAPSQLYPFEIEANHSNGPPAHVGGSLQVLPMGTVEFTCNPHRHRIPTQRLSFRRSDPVTYQLYFENRSNLLQICKVEIQGEKRLEWISPDPLELNPGEAKPMLLVVKVKRPWFGRVKNFVFEVATTLSDQRLGNTNPNNQILKLEVLPIFPTWLAVCGAIFFLWLAWWCSWLNPASPFFGHRGAVNSVQLDGLGRSLVSGSNDQTINEWSVAEFSNPMLNQDLGEIGNARKAVRVVRFKPVDNDLVAAGLENGEIQLWNLTGHRSMKDQMSYQRDDRVFALAFTQDSRRLFSGHGSGWVLQWDVNFRQRKELDNINYLILQKKFNFAVSDLKLVGKDDTNLAIGGRYNQLVVWNWENDELLQVPYPQGGQDDYILSLDNAEFNPELLVTADNQGAITLWNMQNCLTGNSDCKIIDRWPNGHGGQPVRSVALSADGCYLASGGDDGRVMLWPLTADGRRAGKFIDGKEVVRSYNRKKFNSVDIKVVNENIFIASGSDDTEVRVEIQKGLPELGCDQ